MSGVRFVLGGIYIATGVFTSATSLFCNMENIYFDRSFRNAEFPTFFVGRVLYPIIKAGIHGTFCIYFLPRWSYDAIHDKRRFLKHFTAVSFDNKRNKLYSPSNFSYPFWINFERDFDIKF